MLVFAHDDWPAGGSHLRKCWLAVRLVCILKNKRDEYLFVFGECKTIISCRATVVPRSHLGPD
ncbi:hypothetical protein HYX13_02970 [Candidatus Woesearchaeota archaeon]|nr:hypothetical protein [Candidatus Woesearchaeota archaeon]